MYQSMTPNSKKKHYNRFAYLLDEKQEQSQEINSKNKNFFDFGLCAEDACKSSQLEVEIKQPVVLEQKKQIRKILKFQLQSENYDFFKQKIQQKSSLNSFYAVTPQKQSQKQFFSVYNEISTIQNTNRKSNYVNTQQNLIQIYDEKSQSEDILQRNFKPICHQQISMDNHKGKQDRNKLNKRTFAQIQANQYSIQQSQSSINQFFPIKRHRRTMTQNISMVGDKIDQVAQRTGRCKANQVQSSMFRLSQSNRTFGSSNQNQFLKRLQTQNEFPGNPTIMKTIQMSNKLRQSSSMNYENSISNYSSHQTQKIKPTIPQQRKPIYPNNSIEQKADQEGQKTIRVIKLKRKINLTSKKQ